MTTTASERFNKDNAAAISFWAKKEDIPFIYCQTYPEKKVWVNDWPNIDYTNVDFADKTHAQNLNYQNLEINGIAIILGQTIHKDCYIWALDFDGWDAIEKWFNTWEDVEESAKKTRIEHHKSNDSIHYLFKSKRPLGDGRNHKIKISQKSHIEVRVERQLLFSWPSIHESGEQYIPIIDKEIAVLDELQLRSIEMILNSLYRNYISDDNIEEYIKYLENSSFGVKEGRHIGLVALGCSYYYRSSGEWLDYSDDDRKTKLWEWNLKQRPPKEEREFNYVWSWIVKNHRENKDKEHEEIRRTRRNNDFENMPGCISYEISPGRYIFGTPDNKIAEITRKFIPHETIPNKTITTVTHVKTFTACKPKSIVKHINPLSFLEIQDKYTIEFTGTEQSGCFTLKHKSLSEIVSALKNTNALTDKGIDNAIIAQMKGFEKAGLLEVNDSLDYTGFFPSANHKIIICSNIKIPEDYPDVSDALNFISELESRWYRDREDLLAHILSWFMIAPCSFIFKVINAPLLGWVQSYGNPNTGKTSSGLIGLAMDGNECNEDFNLNMKHIDTLARFGDTISNTTFPKIINEVDLTERDDIVNNIITAVDAVKFRKTLDRNRNSEYSPGLTPLFLTGNPQAPTKPEYVKRVKTRYSASREVHLPNSVEAIEYKKWLACNMQRAHVLGEFRNKWIMEHQDIILDTELSAFDKSLKIWKAIYESVSKLSLPQFFNMKLDENQMSDSLDDRKTDISSALQAWIVDKCRSLDTNPGLRYDRDGREIGEKKILDEFTKSTDRLGKLIDRNLIPYVKRDSMNHVVFYRQIVIDLEDDYSVKGLDLPTLGDAIPNAKYGKFKHGYKVVTCSMTHLDEFFGEETINEFDTRPPQVT